MFIPSSIWNVGHGKYSATLPWPCMCVSRQNQPGVKRTSQALTWVAVCWLWMSSTPSSVAAPTWSSGLALQGTTSCGGVAITSSVCQRGGGGTCHSHWPGSLGDHDTGIHSHTVSSLVEFVGEHRGLNWWHDGRECASWLLTSLHNVHGWNKISTFISRLRHQEHFSHTISHTQLVVTQV